MDGVQIRASLYLSNLIVRAISSCNPSRHCQKEEVRKTERGMDQCKSSYLLLSASSHDGVQIRASIYLSNLAVRSPKSGDEETRAEKRRTGMNPQQTESSAACKNDDRALCERSRFAPPHDPLRGWLINALAPFTSLRRTVWSSLVHVQRGESND